MYDHLESMMEHIYLNSFYPIHYHYTQYMSTFFNHKVFNKQDANIENQEEASVEQGLCYAQLCELLVICFS